MVKAYMSKKLKIVTESIGQYEQDLKRSQDLEVVIRENIRKIQEDSDIDFEIFSPRLSSQSLKEEINGLYENLNQVMLENMRRREEISILREKQEKYRQMLDEIIKMERNSNKYR